MKFFFVAWFLNFFVRFFHYSYRYRIIGVEHFKDARMKSPFKTCIVALWHQNMFPMLTWCINTRFTTIISKSKDGDFMAYTAETFGHVPARGSSSRGGKEALLEVIKEMKKGLPATMAIDGPRGPIYKVKPGTIEMARQTESAIIPWTCSSSSYWQFNSWDKMKLPKPFSKIVIIFGEPIWVDKNISTENFTKTQDELAEKIHQLTLTAESVLKDF